MAQLAPLRIQKVTEPQAHLIAAHDWLKGMDVLAGSKPLALRAFIHLSGQAVESLLAAFILTRAKGAQRRVTKTHDLVAMWRCAAGQGLGVPASPPDWLVQLALGHIGPFLVRYQAVKAANGTTAFVHGMGNPSPAVLHAAVAQLEAVVRPFIEEFQAANG
ncbi:MAG: hypothetical protein DI587_36410 [Variovorax paradoxus]|nr:MAG: hypothetical protein DI583_36410 [Variovorax paradoxus]PZQ00789.1 MAG: hypothetical protein DI587_36410 [Variovorax paradoxus]